MLENRSWLKKLKKQINLIEAIVPVKFSENLELDNCYIDTIKGSRKEIVRNFHEQTGLTNGTRNAKNSYNPDISLQPSWPGILTRQL